jgi:hypothetical protein
MGDLPINILRRELTLKNRKLFAILTLVAFMMTLLPVAAFAAADVESYSAAASSVKVTKASVDVYATTDDLAKFTVTFKDSSNSKVYDTDGDVVNTFYIKTDRDAVVGWVDLNANGKEDAGEAFDPDAKSAMASKYGYAVTNAKLNSDSEVMFYIGSGLTGDVSVKVYNEANADEGLLIGSGTVKVGVGDGKVDKITVIDEDGDEIYDSDFDYEKAQNSTYYTNQEIGDTETKALVMTAGDGLELKAVVKSGNVEIEDEEVTFQVRYEGGSFKTLATKKSDEDGVAKYYFEETKTGTYEYRVKVDDENSAVFWVEVKANDPAKVTSKTSDGAKVAEDQTNKIEFVITDKYDNLVKNKTGVLRLEVKDAPEGSKWEDHDSGEAALDTDDDGEYDWSFDPDELGTYTIKATLYDYNGDKTRNTLTFDVEAVEWDDVTDMVLTVKNMDTKTVTNLKYVADASDKPAQAGYLEVDVIGNDGVKIDAPSAELDVINFASSNNDVLTVSNTGEITVTDDDFIGPVTITAVHTDDNVSASIDVYVVGEPVAIDTDVVVDGNEAVVKMQYLDKEGNKTFGGDADGTKEEESYSVVVPKGVIARNVDNFEEDGTASFELVADEYGTYKVTVITDDTNIAKTFTVTFEQPASEKPVYGAKNVTMFIGSTGYVKDGSAITMDQAPFIQDGRTFVPVRMVGEALGAEVEYDAATQVITLTRPDLTVTMTVGSNVLTKSDGTTVVSDVAPFIVAETGRTVIPFRAIAEAFGATVEAVFAADGTVTAVTFAQ